MISEDDLRLRSVAGVGLTAMAVVIAVGAFGSLPMGNSAVTHLGSGPHGVKASLTPAEQLCAVQPAPQDVVPHDEGEQAQWLAALPESFPHEVGQELVKQHNVVMAKHPGVLIGAFVNREQPEFSAVLVVEDFAGSGDLTHVVVCDRAAQ